MRLMILNIIKNDTPIIQDRSMEPGNMRYKWVVLN